MKRLAEYKAMVDDAIKNCTTDQIGEILEQAEAELITEQFAELASYAAFEYNKTIGAI